MRHGRYRLMSVVALATIIAGHTATLFAQDGESTCRAGLPADIALSACTAVIDAKPSSPKDLSAAYATRALALRSRNEPARAELDLDEAIRLDPSNVAAHLARGNMRRQRKAYDKAKIDFDAAIAAEPTNANASFQRAYFEKEQGDNDRAIADYSRAIELDPKQAMAHNNRGVIFRELRRFDEAISDFDEAIRLTPNSWYPHMGRGRILAERKDRDSAIAEFGNVIRLNGTNAEAFFRRAYQENGKDQVAALADYSEAIRLNPRDATALQNRGIIKRTSKDYDGAIADFTQTLALDPVYVGALTHRGLTYEARGEPEKARDDFRAALTLPAKYDNGPWALSTARTRLATLDAASAPSVLQTPSPNVPASGASASSAREKAAGAAPATARIPARSDRVALVIGNGAYANVPALPNPAADARAIAASLREIGFAVTEGVDLGHRDMEDRIVSFLRRLPGSRVAVVFYAGHGVQVDGRNYLVPVDAKSITRATLSFELVDVDRILTGLDDESRANVLILDACRDDPLESRTVGRSAGARGGLAAYSDVASGMLIAFSTAPGKTAGDGDGENSPFTTALLKYVKQPVEINEMLRQVRVDVFNATQKQQLPWANSSLLGQVFLSPPTPQAKNAK